MAGQRELCIPSRAKTLKLQHQNHQEGYLKHRCLHLPQSFWCDVFGVEPPNVPFSQVPHWCPCCCSGDHTPRTIGLLAILLFHRLGNWGSMEQNDCSKPQSKLKLARNSGRLPRWCSGKESGCRAGEARDTGLISGLGRSSGGGNCNPCQCSFLENSMDRKAWWATVHGVTKN